MTDFERIEEYVDLMIEESEAKNESLRSDILANGTVLIDLMVGDYD